MERTIQTDSVAINFHFRRPDLPCKIKNDLLKEESKKEAIKLKVIKAIETPEELKLRKENESKTRKLEKIRKAQEEIQEQDRRISSENRVIGNDPGRSTLFCGVEKLSNGKFRKYSLSRKQFYTESGITDATKKSNKWNVDYLGEELNELSTTNSRSNKLEDFKEYVEVVNKHYIKLWDEASKKKHSRQRFSLYSAKKSVYDKFFGSFTVQGDLRQITIAYGDAGFASTSKYELSAPTSALEKQCSKWYTIVKVDEFRTTKMHYLSGTILTKVQEQTTIIENGKVSKKTIRGLLWYNSTKASKFIDRDLNAAKNILHCYYLFPERPPGLSRSETKLIEPTMKIIKKVIKGKKTTTEMEPVSVFYEALSWLKL